MYPDIDYINEIKWLIRELSYAIRKAKTLDEDSIIEMQSFTIDLLEILEQYKNDKYYY